MRCTGLKSTTKFSMVWDSYLQLMWKELCNAFTLKFYILTDVHSLHITINFTKAFLFKCIFFDLTCHPVL